MQRQNVLQGVSPESPEAKELVQVLRELFLGDSQPFIETYFKIKDVHGALVPMKFLPLQKSYQEACYGNGWQLGQPRDITILKARKATASAWATADDTAWFLGYPGCDVAVIANSEDTLSPLSNMVDTFYKNMPEYARPPIYNQVWGTEKRQVLFQDANQTIINTMVMSSSKSPNFGRGYTIRIVHLDENAFFVDTFDVAALQNSVGGNAVWKRISTANGQDKHFYPSVLSAKKQETRSQAYSFHPWPDNPENWYGPDDYNRRTEDIAPITPGYAVGLPLLLVQDEPLIVDKFPPGKSIDGYLSFRRRKLTDALKANANDPRAALSAFYAEYPEDDIRCFQNLLNPIFDTFLLDQQIKMAEREIMVDSWTDGGMTFRAWRKSIPGHSYAGGLDYSAMKGRDASSLQVKDLSTGEYVAELHGLQGNSVPDVTNLAVKVLTAYNYGLLIPETNNMGRTQGNFAHFDLGYVNTYLRPRKPAESPESEAFLRREYGWETTTQSRKDMIVAGQSHFNHGQIRILNVDLLKDMQQWNPEQQRDGVDATKKHFPDRLSGFFILEAVDPRPDVSTLYGNTPSEAVPALRIVQPRRYNPFTGGR